MKNTLLFFALFNEFRNSKKYASNTIRIITNRLFLSFILICLPLISYCQLPGNFNLIGDSRLQFIAGKALIDDTVFSDNCWGKAGREVSYIDAMFNAHYDTLTKDFKTELFDEAYFMDLKFPSDFRYSIPSKTIFDTSSLIGSRSYVQNRLHQPLTAGKVYIFSIYYIGFKQSIKSFIETGKRVYEVGFLRNLGVLFTNSQVKDFTNRRRIDKKPQINFTNWSLFKKDTIEYFKLSAHYTAIGGEQFVTIGNFDYLSDVKIGISDLDTFYYPDTISIMSFQNFYFNPSLVSDTTLPIISLDHFSLGKDTTIACVGDSITLGGEEHFFHYWWNTGDTSRFITAKAPGTYWCRVDFGCSTYTDTIVVKPLDFSFSLGKDTSINCTGSTIRLKAPDGYSYVWSNGATTAYLDITSPGKYWCCLDYGCGTFTDTILVKPNPFSFSLGRDSAMYCFNDSLVLAAAVAGTYLWNTGENGAGITVRMPGIYWCRVFDGCTFYTDTIIIAPILVHFSLGNDTIICANAPLIISVPVGKTIVWNTGETAASIEIKSSGTYWCSIDFGCNTATDTIVISGSVAPPVFILENIELCEAQLPLTVSAPYTAATYLWSNGSTGFSANFNTVGKQWLRISNACDDKNYTDTFEIISLNIALNNINLGKDTSNCLYGFFLDTITLQIPANAGNQIKWSSGSTGNIIKVNEPGAYWVQVSNVCYSVSDTINISGCAARDVPKVDIPNAFTPNGDGRNDVFRLRYLPQQVVSFTLKIYNRYGQMIRELKSRNDEWDGGEYELGVYYYLFVYKDVSGKEYTQKGDISLLR